MGHVYRAVQWNANKVAYDLALAVGAGSYIAIFLAASLLLVDPAHRVSPAILLIRALGTCAFLMLTVILAIGPLARLDARFLPLLYNRRHFGVMTFCIVALHFLVVLAWYHGSGALNPFVSLFVSNPRYDSFVGFPFEILGLAAFVVLLLMAATSHDFWLATLSPAVWKSLHMLVYPAYGLICLHVALGFLQDEVEPIYVGATIASFAIVGGLHVLAGRKAAALDRSVAPEDGPPARSPSSASAEAGWLAVGPAADIPEGCAKVVTPPQGEAIAVFRYDGKVSAVSNLCAHQMGPLGEGRIVDGCITCPWHGYQYLPETGASPPPFTERIATYRVRVVDGDVYVDPAPLAPGTRVEPALIGEKA
ncbi:MAG: ferric reductase-like transmembrane domain-containing protein [Alphaproteobacteria bacterium]|nr:ferric reductase-like transmembrane domain-containing protein [Alphaproteobacteria bacterium]